MKVYARRTVASLLGINERSVAQFADECDTPVMRAENGPKTRLYSIQNVFDIAAHIRKKKGRPQLPKRVITTNIPRGGTGKTLLATNMAVSFALNGIKTLLIDVDYQGSATLLMGYDPDIDGAAAKEIGLPEERGIDYHLGHLLGLANTPIVPFEKVVKHPFGPNGPALIPADVTLTKLDNQLTVEKLNDSRKPDLAFDKWLKTSDVLKDYEAVIFDSGPGYNRVIRCALAASNMVIAPVGMERVSDKGLRILADEIENIEENLNLKVTLRIVANNMVSTSRALSELKRITTEYPGMTIPYTIRRGEDVPKSYAGPREESLLPFMLEFPSSEITAALKSVSSVVYNELWTEGSV